MITYVSELRPRTAHHSMASSQVTSMSEVHQELQALRARNFSNIFTTSFLD